MDPRMDLHRFTISRTDILIQLRKIGSILLKMLPLIFLGLFYFYPIIKISVLAFYKTTTTAIPPLFDALRSSYILHVIGFTFWQAILSTILTLLAGLPPAYLFARYQFPGKSFIRSLTAIPFVLPTLVVAAAFNSLFGPHGWINVLLMTLFGFQHAVFTLTNSLTAILVAHVFYNLTIVIRLVGDYWSRLDARLVQASRTLGANSWQSFWRITFPLLRPALLAAALLVLIFDFTSFGVILILGGPRYATLEVEIYYQATGLLNMPMAMALSFIQLGCTLAMTVIYSRLSAAVSRPIRIQSSTQNLSFFKNHPQRVMAFFIIGFLIVFQLLPLIGLLGRSILHAGLERGQHLLSTPYISLDYYRELFINRRQSLFYVAPGKAIAVSVSYALTTVVLSLLLGLPTAWLFAQDSNDKSTLHKIQRITEPLLMLPLGTSAVTMGLGFLVAFDRPPLDLRASPLLIPMAHTLVAFPFVVRSLLPAWRSIRPQLHHAAELLGANPSQIFLRVDLPLIGKAVIVAAVFAFSISLGEFGATSLLARPEYPTIPIAIYRYLSQPGEMNYGQGLALSVILMLVTALGMISIEHLRVGEVGEF
ncbi:MAG: ABC transporter permease [Anaerolineales bacterium]